MFISLPFNGRVAGRPVREDVILLAKVFAQHKEQNVRHRVSPHLSLVSAATVLKPRSSAQTHFSPSLLLAFSIRKEERMLTLGLLQMRHVTETKMGFLPSSSALSTNSVVLQSSSIGLASIRTNFFKASPASYALASLLPKYLFLRSPEFRTPTYS